MIFERISNDHLLYAWECDGFCVIGGGALLPSQLIPQVCKTETEMIMIVNSVI